MDQVHVIRDQVLVEGRSQRAVARSWGPASHGAQVAGQAAPVQRKEAAARPRPVWDAVARASRGCWPSRCGGRAAGSG